MTLKRIDFTGNIISEIEDGAFAKLTMLEELSLAENQLVKLPLLPAKLVSFNANHNKLRTKGIKSNAFKVKSHTLHYLFENTISQHTNFCFWACYFFDVVKCLFKNLNFYKEYLSELNEARQKQPYLSMACGSQYSDLEF